MGSEVIFNLHVTQQLLFTGLLSPPPTPGQPLSRFPVCMPERGSGGPVNVIYKSWKEALEENNPVSILISDFQPPENCEELFLLLTPPRLQYFFLETLANECSPQG